MQEASSRENNISTDTTMIRPDQVRKALEGMNTSADGKGGSPAEKKSDDLEMVYLEDEPDMEKPDPAKKNDKNN